MPATRNRLAAALAVGASAALVLITGPGAAAQQEGSLPPELAQAVSGDNINRHLIALQRIADQNGGTRAASTAGYNRSAEYIAGKLADAGYDVTRQKFPFVYDETTAERLTSGGASYDAVRMSYSPSTPDGGVTAPLVAVPVDDTPGCGRADYDDVDVTGKIALIKRGTCTFYDKQQYAAQAGAVGAVIYNDERGPVLGTLGEPGQIPTAGVPRAQGEKLIEQAGEKATLTIEGVTENRTTYNVIAQTKTGRKDNVVMAGAHLDSVPGGPGINDNGSGAAGLLQTALALGGEPKVENAVRFAWWGAEELGLVGSDHYVEQLSFEQQLDIAMYLNFDMIASPNAGYFVYDGDDSDGVGAGPGPYGSAAIEQDFASYLRSGGTPTEGTDFTGRSDYGPFIEVGIPSGGLFTGAEVKMTEAQAEKWGGEAGVAYDECYHQACDTLGNVDYDALDVNADAMAATIGMYALSTEDVNGVAPDAAKSRTRVAAQRFGERMRTSHGHADADGNRDSR